MAAKMGHIVAKVRSGCELVRSGRGSGSDEVGSDSDDVVESVGS